MDDLEPRACPERAAEAGGGALAESARHLLAARIALYFGVTFAEAHRQIDLACRRISADATE